MTQTDRTKVFLIGVNMGAVPNYSYSMQELELLAQACGMEAVGQCVQNMPAIHKALYIGTGKAAEIRELAQEAGAELLLLNDSLTPSQLANLQDETGLAVMDRTTLILEIFASRAKTHEAMLQVEVARLQYMMPRLIGLHEALTRQGGASGSMSSRGGGEKQLELDRRKIQHRLTQLRRELEEMENQRQVQQKKREKSALPRVALVGYTNAGKSTLMNALMEFGMPKEEYGEKKVFVRDMLFATLDTMVRRVEVKENQAVLLSDTVGFIDRLPHGLVKAFRSTLSEAVSADLILHVVDFADAYYKEHMEVTKNTLREIGAGDVPVLTVFNKVDLVQERAEEDGLPCFYEKAPKVTQQAVYLSAQKQQGVKELAEEIAKRVYAGRKKCEMLLPYSRGDIFSYLKENANVISAEYGQQGIQALVECSEADCARLREYVTHICE